MPSIVTSVESPEAATVIRFQDRVLDEQAVQVLGERLLPPARDSGWPDLELDLGGVDHVTAGGLGGLILLRQQLFSRGVGLTLRNVKRPVYNVFELTNLTRVLDVHPQRAAPVRRRF